MPQLQRTGLLAGCGLLLVVIVLNASLCYRQVRALHDDSTWVTHSQDVINSLEEVNGLLKDAETGQRGYVITGKESYLEPFRVGTDQLAESLDRLGRLTADNTDHQDRLPRLRELSTERIAILDRIIAIRRKDGFEPAQLETLKGDGKTTMDSIRALVSEMQQGEITLLNRRKAINDQAYRSAVWNCILTVPLGMAALGAFLWLFNKHLKTQQEATAKIHEQRELLQATLISIGDAVIATDREGRITFMNYVAETLTGWPNAEARGLSLEKVFHIVNEDTRREVENPAIRALRDGTITGLANHTILIARDKTEWPIDDSAAPIRDENGKIVGAILVFREIQERKRRELELASQSAELKIANHRKDELVLALQTSEERLRLALAAGHMGVWDWEIPDDRLTWSDQVYSIHGIDPKSFRGRADDFSRLVHPEDKSRIDESIQLAMAGKANYDVEFRIVRPDGEVRWVLTSGQVVFDLERKPQRMLGATIDTTERKRAEETFRFLADASDTLSALVDYNSTMQKVARQAVPFFCDFCIVYMVSEAGEIERVAAAHCNVEKERLLSELNERFPVTWQTSSPVIEALRTGSAQFVESVSEELLSTTVPEEERLNLIKQLSPRSFICVPLVVREMRLGCLLLGTSDSGRRYRLDDMRIATDLARRAATAVDNARLYREVKESARQKDDFIAMLAHELRNPLAAIHYANELTKMPGAMPHEEISEIISRQTNSLMRLIDDLLDISRITRNKISLQIEYVDAANVVRRAIDTTRPLIEEKHHQLQSTIETGELGVYADVMRLEQILVNLLSNAAKYTNDGGRIDVSVGREGDQVVFRVRDNGIGIEPKLLSDVFDLFMQVGGSLDRAQGGLGLGLTIVRSLVTLHHGTVSAMSEGPGKGSEFIVRLPFTARPNQAATVNQAPQARRSLEILVVDDNSDMARSIGLLLTNNRHRVRIANERRLQFHSPKRKLPTHSCSTSDFRE